jgi:hypothetical protein
MSAPGAAYGQRRGRDADDRVVDAAERERAADHRRVAAEAPLPEPFADHRDRRRARPILVRREAAAAHRLQPEHRQ